MRLVAQPCCTAQGALFGQARHARRGATPAAFRPWAAARACALVWRGVVKGDDVALQRATRREAAVFVVHRACRPRRRWCSSCGGCSAGVATACAGCGARRGGAFAGVPLSGRFARSVRGAASRLSARVGRRAGPLLAPGGRRRRRAVTSRASALTTTGALQQLWGAHVGQVIAHTGSHALAQACSARDARRTRALDPRATTGDQVDDEG
jgi:hypothetical protein